MAFSESSLFFHLQFNGEKFGVPISKLHKLSNIVALVRERGCYTVQRRVDERAFQLLMARLFQQRSEMVDELKRDIQLLCDELGYQGFAGELGLFRTESSASVGVSNKVREDLKLVQERMDGLEEEWEIGRGLQRRHIADREDRIRELEVKNADLKKMVDDLNKKISELQEDQCRCDALKAWQRASLGNDNWKLPDSLVQDISKGAEKGDCDCQWVYAEYLFRHEREADAVKYYKMAADKDHREAQWRYAKCCSDGTGCEENLTEAAKYYKMAADKGHRESQWEYGRCLEYGKGVKKNLVDSVSGNCWEFYRSAAEQGHVEAMCKYAKHQLDETNLEEAAAMYKRAAKRHAPEAVLQYGKLLSDGYGVMYNAKKACVYFKRAACMGLPDAMVEYGRCLRDGKGCKKDLQNALSYFEQAVKKGSPDGMFELGICCRDGIGCVQDIEEAKRLFEASHTPQGQKELEKLRNREETEW